MYYINTQMLGQLGHSIAYLALCVVTTISVQFNCLAPRSKLQGIKTQQ